MADLSHHDVGELSDVIRPLDSLEHLFESSLFGSRLIFGSHFPLLIALLRDARALYGKCVLDVISSGG